MGEEDHSFVFGKKFCVDYSKNGRAKCRKCNKFIEKDLIRVGKNVRFKEKYILHYFHVECVFESFKRAKDISNVITNAKEIAGIQNITDEERRKIKDFIGNLDVDRLKRKNL